jgi:phosphotriesterase-related protein
MYCILEKIARKTGLTIITNTGFYGATNNKYIPAFAFNKKAKSLLKYGSMNIKME